MTTPTSPIAAVPAQPDAPTFTDAQIASACMSYRHDFGLLEPDERTKIMFTAREWERAFAKERQSAAQGAAERAVPAATVIKRGANREFMSERLGHLPDGIYSLYLAATPAHVQPPAQTEHVAADVSENGLKSNMTGGAALPAHHTDNAPFGYTAHEKSAWSFGYEEGYRASHAQAPAGAVGVVGRTIPRDDDQRAAAQFFADNPSVALLAFNRHMRQPTPTAQAAPAAGAVAGPDGMMRDELRNMIEGMSVSVDVSTGDHDAGHRYFGTVTEVMDCRDDKHGVTLLVQDAEPNFAPTPAAQADSGAQEDAALRPPATTLFGHAMQYAPDAWKQTPISQAALDVLTERQRQISAEGWTPEHDDEHNKGELAVAAALYATRGYTCASVWVTAGSGRTWGAAEMLEGVQKWIKPCTTRRALVKSGALILAELERLDRAALAAKGGSNG